MKTCDTCKHWGREVGDRDGYRECDKSCNGYESPEDRAGVADGEPYNCGSMATGPKFGCIHHEQK